MPETDTPHMSPADGETRPVDISPFYEDDAVTIYHGDCRDILPELTFDLIVSDPPYGIDLATNYGTRKRGALSTSNDWGDRIVGDARPFDPELLLSFGKPTVLFGGNHYANRLPATPTWLIWDKLDGLTSKREVGFNDQADAEVAWSNLGGPARLFRFRWMGAMKTGVDKQTPRRHPTEKPIELMTWVLRQCPPGLVADPYMGSGSTLRAAKDQGRKAVGIEIEERYCEVAARRMGQEVLDFGGAA